LKIAPASVRAGDAVLLSGDIGRHGVAIMAVREGLEFESAIESDCAPVASTVAKLIDAGIEVHCLRDLTRGGLGTTLIEIAETANLHIGIEEMKIPVQENVQAACELLGFDPLYLANEGRFTAIVPEAEAEKALELMRSDEQGKGAVRIGTVTESPKARVTLKSRIGTTRIVDMLSGEQLPRIC
jgi:hydrogenase expression/formation protein HypE